MSSDDLPPYFNLSPDAALKSLGDPETTMHDVVSRIEKDPNLVASILREMGHTVGVATTDDARVGDEVLRVGDVAGGIAYLETLPYYSGKVGAIGFCSGGRQTVIVASRLDIDAAVDCWGGRVVMAADQLTDRMPVAPIDMTADLRCPLLGIFGLDDQAPSPEEVDQHEAGRKAHGKTYKFHRYEGGRHGFIAVDRPSYRVEQAVDAWRKVFAWYDRHLSG